MTMLIVEFAIGVLLGLCYARFGGAFWARRKSSYL